MDEARTQYLTAIDLANDALANYRNEPTSGNFRIWRDASEVAIKWCRAQRLGREEPEGADELEQLLAG